MGDRQAMGGGSALDPSSGPGVEYVSSSAVDSAPTLASNRTPGAGAQACEHGDVLAGRYLVVRFIARGGMGEVYEAEDLELHERVALKSVRASIAEADGMIERFKREIHLARQVTHPNVCRIFDLGFHRPPGQRELVFLTMELLSGATLAERLQQMGRMTTREALPLALQMAAGLEAAHRAGIVHRDFKSRNVVLSDQGDGTRAVVTDFGLARADARDTEHASQPPVPGRLVGTPAYMAPEQVLGGEVTPRTDVYALGLVLYEMVTGQLPFSGDSTVETALKRVDNPPPPPRTFVPELDARWEQVILRCLERDPSRRFASARAVAEALEGRRPEWAGPRRRWRLGTALLLGGLLLGALLWYAQDASSGWRAMHASRRRSVAVLGFRSLSGRPEVAWLSTALGEMLTTELAAGEALRTVPGETVARMKLELSLGDADSLGAATLARVRGNIDADLVVLGSYLALGKEGGGKIRLDVRLQDAHSGATVATWKEEGTEAELIELVTRTGGVLRERIGVGALRGGEVDGVRASQPRDAEATRLYAEGVAKLRSFELPEARDLLAQAVARAPDFPLGHAALAEAWTALGHEDKAAAAARQAFQLSARLGREERLLVEAHHQEAAGQPAQAAETYRTLFRFFPDNIEYGLLLARTETTSGRPKAALATLATLRQLPAPSGDDPRVDLEEAFAASRMGDYQAVRAATARAADKGERREARLLVARARAWSAEAAYNLGEYDRARATAEEAIRLGTATGDRACVARALATVAYAAWHRGDHRTAAAKNAEVLKIYRELGHRNLADALGDGAQVALAQGDLARALALAEEAEHVGRTANAPWILIQPLTVRAWALYLAGDLPASQRAFERAQALAERNGDQLLYAWGLSRQAELYAASGDVAGARRRLEESLAIRSQLGLKEFAAESRLGLAQLAAGERRGSEAERLAREALAEFRRRHAADNETLSLVVLGRALHLVGREGEARATMDEAEVRAAASQSPMVRWTATLAAVRARPTPQGVAALEQVIAEATRRGFVAPSFEARLALGEAQAALGRRAEGRAQLILVERDARRAGLHGVARAAAAAARRR